MGDGSGDNSVCMAETMTDLTSAQVLKEPAGPRINAWVAERVMGLLPRTSIGKRGQSTLWYTDSGELVNRDWSADISAAMEALEDVVGAGYYKIESGYSGETIVEIVIPGSDVRASADTIEVAICRAALLTTLARDVTNAPTG